MNNNKKNVVLIYVKVFEDIGINVFLNNWKFFKNCCFQDYELMIIIIGME